MDASAHDGSTPLILATRLGVENVVEELIANRVDVEAVDKRGENKMLLGFVIQQELFVGCVQKYSLDRDVMWKLRHLEVVFHLR